MRKVLIFLLFVKLHISLASVSKLEKHLPDHLDQFGTAPVFVHCEDGTGSKRETHLIRETIENIRELVHSSTDTRTRAGGGILTALIKEHQSLSRSFLSEVTQILDKLIIQYKLFWIPLVIYIPAASWLVINSLLGIDIVRVVRLEKIIPIIIPSPIMPSPPPPPITGNTTWNLGLTNTRCNKIKKLGDGVVVAIIDSGVLWDHQELKANFRNNDFSWWDPDRPATSRFPRDTDGHGTHVAGIAVGKNVGVAPNATWITCLACLEVGCPHSMMYECMEYMACPWRWNDTSTDKVSKDASQRPHVINMSLGSLGGSQVLYPSHEADFKYIAYWNLLGIVSTISGGNDGPGCGSMGSAASFYNVFSVGNVDANATINLQSSRGPVLSAERPFANSSNWEGASVFLPPSLITCTNLTLAKVPIFQIIKPDIVAPGTQINSSWFTGVKDYLVISGTSMSAPHVAGIMALVISANPKYAWNATVMYNLLRSTATQDLVQLHGVGPNVSPDSASQDSNILCNFWTSEICNKWPNNVYGKGLANACLAVEAAKKLGKETLVLQT